MVNIKRKGLEMVVNRPKAVRVRATSEDYRAVLKHGVTGQRFMPDISQSVEWPNDTFTRRRLKEGSVELEEAEEREQPEQKSEKPERRDII